MAKISSYVREQLDILDVQDFIFFVFIFLALVHISMYSARSFKGKKSKNHERVFKALKTNQYNVELFCQHDRN